MTLQDHPIANIFPLLSEPELAELTADIKANGLKQPVVIYEGKILDGRNRYRGCVAAGVEPRTTTYDGDSPAAFVLSLNLHRRHLTKSQSAAVAVEVLPWLEKEAEAIRRKAISSSRKNETSQKIDSSKTDRNAPRSTTHAADMFGTNRQYVSDAKAIKAHSPETFEAVKRGEKTIIEAKREIRNAAIAKSVQEYPADKFRVIYADPPWEYGDKKNLDGYSAAVDHYPTMRLADICSMPVASMAADDAVLFLWATSPLLPEGLEVAKAWGFKYKACFVWDKVRHNMGHYNSVRHEFLLICTKGSCTPDKQKLFDSVVSVERTEHSTKPEEFREIIQTLYPNGKRLELFARRKADGWETWGNQA